MMNTRRALTQTAQMEEGVGHALRAAGGDEDEVRGKLIVRCYGVKFAGVELQFIKHALELQFTKHALDAIIDDK